MKIGIIVSNFYPKISKMLIDGAISKLKNNRISNFKKIIVPGTYEIPVVVSNLINKYDAFVVLGCIIKGKTSHFHYLCSSVTNSLLDLSIKSKKPIGNGILTCNNKKQAIERADPKKKDKGGDAANAVISVLKIIK
tara:strand:- start:440 stop:847 length:408 start_codon:yes stop_codon:yes gene_type:complete